MTDNNQQPPEDFSHQDHHEMVEEQPPAGLGANLKNAWRTKPLFKLIVIMVVAGAVVAVISNFLGGGKDSTTISKVVAPPSMGGEAPGGKESPYRMKELNEANKTGEQKALQSGTSFIPTPHGEESNVDEGKDPLKELRAETDHLRQMLEDQKRQAQLQQAAPKPQAQQQQPEKFDNSLASAMQSQMQKLMGDWKPKGIRVVATQPKDKNSADAAQATAAANAAAASAANIPTEFKTVVPAGTVNYGQLLTEANSDVPGPILAQIVSGPLAGARAVGSFKVINDYLVLHFDLANLKNKDYAIEALALDPDTTLGGMATEVDERYFTRVVLPAAAAFMQGLGQELGQSNSTVTSTGTTTIVTQGSQGFRQGMYDGFGAAATTAGQFFRDQANKTQPLVRVAAGTPIGFFFVRTVTDQSAEQIAAAQAAVAGGQTPGAASAIGGNPVVTNFGGQPFAGAQQSGPYGSGPLGTPASSGYGGYGGYGGGGAYPGGTPVGAMPVGGVPGYYGH